MLNFPKGLISNCRLLSVCSLITVIDHLNMVLELAQSSIGKWGVQAKTTKRKSWDFMILRL